MASGLGIVANSLWESDQGAVARDPSLKPAPRLVVMVFGFRFSVVLIVACNSSFKPKTENRKPQRGGVWGKAPQAETPVPRHPSPPPGRPAKITFTPETTGGRPFPSPPYPTLTGKFRRSGRPCPGSRRSVKPEGRIAVALQKLFGTKSQIFRGSRAARSVAGQSHENHTIIFIPPEFARQRFFR